MGQYDTSDPETAELLDEQGEPIAEGSDDDPWYADGDTGWADWGLWWVTGGASSLVGGDVPTVTSYAIGDDDGDGDLNITDPDEAPGLDDLGKLPGADAFGKAAGKAIGLGVVALVAAKLLRVF